MEAQFNFQLRHRNDKREWEEIEVYYQTHFPIWGTGGF